MEKSAAATEGQAPPLVNRKTAQKLCSLTEELSRDPEEFRWRPRREPGRCQVSSQAAGGVFASSITKYFESNIGYQLQKSFNLANWDMKGSESGWSSYCEHRSLQV